MSKKQSRSGAEVVRAFAQALDAADYCAAQAVLHPACRYSIRGQTLEGARAVFDSYRGNGDAAASTFDEIRYESRVKRAPGEQMGEWYVVTFVDIIRHAGRELVHSCEQWMQVESGRIRRIEHRDLEGERDKLAAFRRLTGTMG